MRTWTKHPTYPAWVDRSGRVLPIIQAPDGFKPGRGPGRDRPTADNQLFDASKLADEITSPITYSTDYQVIRNTVFSALPKVRAQFVTFENCRLRGGIPSTDLTQQMTGIDTNDSRYRGTLAIGCEFVPQVQQVNMGAAIIGSYVTTYRCHIYGGWCDGLNHQSDLPGANSGACASIADRVIPMVYPHDPLQPRFPGDTEGGPSHSDGSQIANGWDHLYFGTSFEVPVGDPDSHGMVVSPYAGKGIGSTRVIECYFSGGNAGLSSWVKASKDKTLSLKLWVLRNEFDCRGMANDLSGGLYRPQSILMTPPVAAASVISGNVQTHPCTPSDPNGIPYGASATPEAPVPAYVYISKNE